MAKIQSNPKIAREYYEREQEAIIDKIKKETRDEVFSEIAESKKQSRQENITHDLQILILDYLGIGKELTNVKKSKLFAAIINRNEDVTRQKLSSLETFKNKRNLKFLLKYFESIGFEEQIGAIKKELEKKI